MIQKSFLNSIIYYKIMENSIDAFSYSFIAGYVGADNELLVI